MKVNVNIVCNAFLLINLSFVVLKEYSILQNYHYELDKYLYHIKENRKSYFYFLYFLLSAFIMRFDFLYLTFSILLAFYLVRNYQIKYSYRVKRVLVINVIFLTISIGQGN